MAFGPCPINAAGDNGLWAMSDKYIGAFAMILSRHGRHIYVVHVVGREDIFDIS